MINITIFRPTIEWIKDDWRENPLRFVMEVIAWAMSIVCSVIMMLTVPTPPFLIVYPMFITQCVIFGWACWTRKSFGMLSNYILLVTIDTIALAKLILL
jgi:hypothetical protein